MDKTLYSDGLSIVVVIPCFNEETTIEKVVNDFRNELPEARICVFDNNSNDRSAEIARKAGAEVFFEKRKGKGNVVRKIFRTIRADVIIMVDGDDTYFAKDVHRLIHPIISGGADHVVGNRIIEKSSGFSDSHAFGNRVIRWTLNVFFGTKFKDVLSGYRAFSSDFYQAMPLLSKGFEIETELTLQSLERDYAILEVPVDYQDRPKHSHSKIREFSDGYRILFTIASLLRDYRPMLFFSIIGLSCVLVGLGVGLPVVSEYLKTGLVLKLPSAVLAVTLIILGFNSLLSGLVVSTVNRRSRELEGVINSQMKNNG